MLVVAYPILALIFYPFGGGRRPDQARGPDSY
jgi:hypothetical protein